jgi:hypothetical protein
LMRLLGSYDGQRFAFARLTSRTKTPILVTLTQKRLLDHQRRREPSQYSLHHRELLHK